MSLTLSFPFVMTSIFMENIKPQFSRAMQPQFNQLWVASSTMSSLAERVTEAIRESGTDVTAIAKACGVSVQAVYKWMNGLSKTIAGEHLVELSSITNYEARWIISGKGDKKRDPKAVSVYLAMQNMPEYKKDMIVQASTALAEQPKSNGTQ